MNVIKGDFSVIILAAGMSERLGYPKLSLKYNQDNTFVDQIIRQFKGFGCNEIVVVVNKTGYELLKEKSVKLVLNEHPEWHRFFSLKMGLNAITGTGPVFVHNVDNPFINHDVLNILVGNSKKADYLVPEFNGRGGHPVLISNRIVNDIKSEKNNQLHLKEFLLQYPKLKVTVLDKNILVNINTEDEYRKIFPIID